MKTHKGMFADCHVLAVEKGPRLAPSGYLGYFLTEEEIKHLYGSQGFNINKSKRVYVHEKHVEIWMMLQWCWKDRVEDYAVFFDGDHDTLAHEQERRMMQDFDMVVYDVDPAVRKVHGQVNPDTEIIDIDLIQPARV